ncbi:MAG: Zn-ribbon domain-containing OB-fold protein [Methanosarcinales archaeon]
MAKRKIKLPETEEGTILFNIDPIIIKQHYEIDYIHSYAQYTPFFAGLAKKKLLGTKCPKCNYTYATPKTHCMLCGNKTEWVELPKLGKVHTWTTCYFGSEEFLKETPFTLILVEFDGVDTFLLSRLIGVREEEIKIGMKVLAQFRRNLKFNPTDVYFIRY